MDNPKSTLATSSRDHAERLAFQYFLGTCHRLGSVSSDSEFWQKLVPRWANYSQPIWQAVVALSALHQRNDLYSPSRDRTPQRSDRHVKALLWYSQAVVETHQLVKSSHGIAPELLMTCILFFMIEAQQWNMSSALPLLQQGVRIFFYLDERIAIPDRSVVYAFLMSHSRHSHSEHILKESSTNYNAIDRTVLPHLLMTPTCCVPPPPLQEFRVQLFGLIGRISDFTERSARQRGNDNVILLADHQHLERSMLAFRTNVTAWKHSHASGDAPIFFKWCKAHLMAFYWAAYVLLQVNLDYSDQPFKKRTADFAKIINCALEALLCATRAERQPPFTFELDLTKPLLITAIACCDPGMRMQSFDIMHELPTKDYPWNRRAVQAARRMSVERWTQKIDTI